MPSAELIALGAVTAAFGIASHGQGLETTLAQVIAEHLGCRVEDVRVLQGDSAAVPGGTGWKRRSLGPVLAIGQVAAQHREPRLRKRDTERHEQLRRAVSTRTVGEDQPVARRRSRTVQEPADGGPPRHRSVERLGNRRGGHGGRGRMVRLTHASQRTIRESGSSHDRMTGAKRSMRSRLSLEVSLRKSKISSLTPSRSYVAMSSAI